MGNNLIHNYLNTLNESSTPHKKSERRYFNMPSVSSTMESFDIESDKLIKPLDGKGHLVNNDLVHMPKEFARDTVYTTKALADGIRGKANDHQLGKMNDLGLKLSGVAIAAYLMTKKATPKTKAMEFIGFGAFLASMALWPKVALEIPARIIHGFNFRKQYIDDQGRKKYVSQDPNYIPFDLYKGDKKSEDLDVIGDRLGIKRDIPNRHEAVKEQMRKISVQNNTLWMLTAGIATPIMTALACNQAEKYITPITEKYTNEKVNKNIDKVDDYLNGRMDLAQKKVYESKVLKIVPEEGKTAPIDNVDKMLEGLKGRTVSREEINTLADTLAEGFDAEMKDAAKADIENIIGGQRYTTNASSVEKLTSNIHSAIAAKDAGLAAKITPEKLNKAVSNGAVTGAVRDLLTDVGFAINDDRFSRVSTNFKCKEMDGLDFFKVTEETKGMSEVDRLAHNIKSIIMKVNNSNPAEDFISGMSELEQTDRGVKSVIDARLQEGAEKIAKQYYEGELAIGNGRENYIRQSVGKLYKSEAPRGPKFDKLYSTVGDMVTKDVEANRGYVISDTAAETISTASKKIKKFSAIDDVLASAAHFKTEKAAETLVANNWEKVTNTLVKELKITDKELEVASKDSVYSRELFARKLEQVCSDEKGYNEFITKLGKVMVELDEKMDAPNAGGNGRMMSKIESGITRNCEGVGGAFEQLGFSEMKKKMVSSKNSKLDTNVGSIMSSKLERLHGRVEGCHSSYMRLLQSAEFFHRSHAYEVEVAANGGRVTAEIAAKYGFTENAEMNKELIAKGKELLLDAHTGKFYNKMGLHNNKDFFKSLMWCVYRPNKSAQWDANWSEVTERTISTLDKIKDEKSNLDPRRVFEGVERRSLGQKLKEHMNQMYNSFGSIERGVLQMGRETAKVDGGVSPADARACKRFNLLGKAPKELLQDSLKQMYNSKKWMKMFAPVLATTFGLTVLAQFFFGKKDDDIRA